MYVVLAKLPRGKWQTLMSVHPTKEAAQAEADYYVRGLPNRGCKVIVRYVDVEDD